ncbi:MAG: hypothetical protein QXO32_08465 [Candidatus Bathyarchaeia archaeon]
MEELLGEEELEVSTELLEALEKRRKKGMVPFAILTEKSAVELVKIQPKLSEVSVEQS